jgi:hypothetical protein
MTATALTIPERGVSRNGMTLPLPVQNGVNNGISAVGLRQFLSAGALVATDPKIIAKTMMRIFCSCSLMLE